jgi:hypothetical protein
MAATVNIRPTNSDGLVQTALQDKVWETKIDFSTTGYALAQNETMAIWDLPAGVQVEGAKLYVDTAQATITDVDLGVSTDGSTDDGLVDGASLAAASVYKSGGTNATGAVFPLDVDAASQVVFTNKDAQTLNSAVVNVIIKVCDMRESL